MDPFAVGHVEMGVGGEAQISPGKSEFKIKCFALLWGKSD
jgi:hypothetical protein